MAEKKFPETQFIVSKTDLNGTITYGNQLFIQMSEYSESELIGAPHNLLRHKDMPNCVFQLLWDTISKGKEIYAYVKNRSKNDNHYWVFAHVTPSFDINGNTIGYHSVRRSPEPSAIEKIWPIYQLLLSKESTGGTKAGTETLLNHLKQQGITYEQFVLSL